MNLLRQIIRTWPTNLSQCFAHKNKTEAFFHLRLLELLVPVAAATMVEFMIL